MRSNYLVLLAFALPVTAAGQNAPTVAFQQWARQHVHAISSVEDDTYGNADLRALNNIIGGAHVVAFGEPFHHGHEPVGDAKPVNSLCSHRAWVHGCRARNGSHNVKASLRSRPRENHRNRVRTKRGL